MAKERPSLASFVEFEHGLELTDEARGRLDRYDRLFDQAVHAYEDADANGPDTGVAVQDPWVSMQTLQRQLRKALKKASPSRPVSSADIDAVMAGICPLWPFC